MYVAHTVPLATGTHAHMHHVACFIALHFISALSVPLLFTPVNQHTIVFHSFAATSPNMFLV
jgi:hypothetical protein